ncbi:MAG: LamG domain-containing protein [Opitutales bacterium]|nr:LamG domain-containing protein [Opitutales bacterium]
MKKLITISSLLVVGTFVAGAASVVPQDLQNENLLFYWDFATSADPTKKPGSVSVNKDHLTWNEAGYGHSERSAIYSSNVGNADLYANNFTVSFDVANFTANNWENLLSVYTNGSSGDSHALMLQKNNSGKMMLYVGGIGGNTNYFGGSTTSKNAEFVDYSTVHNSDWTTLTFTSDGSTFKVYVDGVAVGEGASLTTTETKITGFQFLSAFGGSRVATSGDLDNIAIWNTALTAAQVSSLCAPVPEPSMFGLLAGLGALSLVGARRRRR